MGIFRRWTWLMLLAGCGGGSQPTSGTNGSTGGTSGTTNGTNGTTNGTNGTNGSTGGTGGTTGGAPMVTVSPLALALLLSDCPEAFSIENSGGGTLSYQVADDGGGSGFLLFDKSSGTLTGAGSALVNVNLDPQYTSVFTPGGPITADGSTLSLAVYTPNAVNVTATHVSFLVVDAQPLVYSFSGSWSGTSTSNRLADGTRETAPVAGGSWTLAIDSVADDQASVTGTLTWSGSDVLWSYDAGNTVTSSASYAVDRSIALDGTNTQLLPPHYTPPAPSISNPDCGYLLIVTDASDANYPLHFRPLLDPISLQVLAAEWNSSVEGSGNSSDNPP